MIRVLLVDDHPLVLDGLRAAMAGAGDMDVVAAPNTIREAIEAVASLRPDVVVSDIRLEDGTGFELLAEASRMEHPPGFLMLSSFDSPQYVAAAQRLGAAGFLLKTAPNAEVVAAVRRIAVGGSAYDLRLMHGTVAWRSLTKRQFDVVAGIIAGRSNDEIAGDLGISRKTVEAHLSKLYARTGALSRTELAVRAEREHWLDIPPGTKRPAGPAEPAPDDDGGR